MALAAWLPFFVLWVAVGMSFGQVPFRTVLANGLLAVGSAGLLGSPVWFACERWPWPLQFRLGFYALQIALAIAYGVTWTAVIVAVESLRGASGLPELLTRAALSRQTLL